MPQQSSIQNKPETTESRPSMDGRVFHVSIRQDGGQSLVEFALMVPMLFLLIVNAVNFGGFIYAWLTVANAVRGAAAYGALGSVSPGSQSAPTTTQISTLVTNDTASLRGSVNVCVNKNTTASAISGTCSFTIASVPPDPEGLPYNTLAVDLNYSYTPLIPAFNFPGFGIYSTLPPTTIRRRAIVRVAN